MGESMGQRSECLQVLGGGLGMPYNHPVPDILTWLQSAIVEMTGNTKVEERAAFWCQPHKRIFFATPQTFRNDIVRGEHQSSCICKITHQPENVTCHLLDMVDLPMFVHD